MQRSSVLQILSCRMNSVIPSAYTSLKRKFPLTPIRLHPPRCLDVSSTHLCICEVQPWNKTTIKSFQKADSLHETEEEPSTAQNLWDRCLLNGQRRPPLETVLGMANLDTERKKETLEWRKSHICITPSVQLRWNSCRKPALGERTRCNPALKLN